MTHVQKSPLLVVPPPNVHLFYRPRKTLHHHLSTSYGRRKASWPPLGPLGRVLLLNAVGSLEPLLILKGNTAAQPSLFSTLLGSRLSTQARVHSFPWDSKMFTASPGSLKCSQLPVGYQHIHHDMRGKVQRENTCKYISDGPHFITTKVVRIGRC